MVGLVALFVVALAVAVVFGTDVFFTVVGRRALASTSAPAMMETMGRLHEVADRRMPFFGVTGIVGSVLTLAVVAAARPPIVVALGAQLIWLAVYLTVAKPINAKMTTAAREGAPIADARDWQQRWDAALIPRSALMAVALVAVLLAIVEAR